MTPLSRSGSAGIRPPRREWTRRQPPRLTKQVLSAPSHLFAVLNPICSNALERRHPLDTQCGGKIEAGGDVVISEALRSVWHTGATKFVRDDVGAAGVLPHHEVLLRRQRTAVGSVLCGAPRTVLAQEGSNTGSGASRTITFST